MVDRFQTFLSHMIKWRDAILRKKHQIEIKFVVRIDVVVTRLAADFINTAVICSTCQMIGILTSKYRIVTGTTKDHHTNISIVLRRHC